jgi:hypothetical protein
MYFNRDGAKGSKPCRQAVAVRWAILSRTLSPAGPVQGQNVMDSTSAQRPGNAFSDALDDHVTRQESKKQEAARRQEIVDAFAPWLARLHAPRWHWERSIGKPLPDTELRDHLAEAYIGFGCELDRFCFTRFVDAVEVPSNVDADGLVAFNEQRRVIRLGIVGDRLAIVAALDRAIAASNDGPAWWFFWWMESDALAGKIVDAALSACFLPAREVQRSNRSTGVDVTAPSSQPDRTTIVKHADGTYSVSGSIPRDVTPSEDAVLTAFLKSPSGTLHGKAVSDAGRKALTRLRDKYPEFQGAIEFPGTGWRGGYHVRICHSNDVQKLDTSLSGN